MRNIFFIAAFAMTIWASSKASETASDIPANTNGYQTETKVNVMSFNIRYDNPDDLNNNWKYRKDRVANTIRFYDADIVGTQEVLKNQFDDLKERLPEYTIIGVGRDDGKEKGEYNALLFKKDRFNVVGSGTFWLSETPDIEGSQGWDGACKRIATWARLHDIASGGIFLALNTHLDHVGYAARKEGVNLILKKVTELSQGAPIIVTGDFNSTPDSDVVNHLTNPADANHLINSKDVAKVVYGPNWSFHDFGSISYAQRPQLDYIFIRGDIDVDRYGILAETENGQYLSDHAPVLATLTLNYVPGKIKGSRPVEEERKFVSHAVEAIIDSVSSLIADEKLREMFAICFPNTLDTTVKFQIKDGKPDTFVITGDINAMWLRDSSAQVWPYLNILPNDERLRYMVAGLINRQAWCLNIDPYANAFNEGPTGSYWESDYTDHMVKELHERKYELDSQCYPIRLAYRYWELTGDTLVFDDAWQEAMTRVVETMRKQQRKDDALGDYRFSRECNRPSDSQINNGWGAPVRYTGMIYSAFRPSDDATQYGFLVPSNMMATVSLQQLAQIEREVYKNEDFASECESLAQEVEEGIRKYAVVEHPSYGKVFAYEVDGFGNHTFMDDANVPSLLSLPYLGYCAPDDSIYLNTRRLVWSEDNPYFFRGKAGAGIGGPHVGFDYPWPMSIIMRGLTSTDPQEVKECLRMLRDTDGKTYMMHESFNKDDTTDFTRSWFAWANTLFGELIITTAEKYPEILSNPL